MECSAGSGGKGRGHWCGEGSKKEAGGVGAKAAQRVNGKGEEGNVCLSQFMNDELARGMFGIAAVVFEGFHQHVTSGSGNRINRRVSMRVGGWGNGDIDGKEGEWGDARVGDVGRG